MTGNTVAKPDPHGMLRTYAAAFTNSMPEHVNGRQWLTKLDNYLRNNPKVAQAAANDPTAFMGAVLNAARLGLEPGTEQYALIPFKDKGVEKVQGIPMYQGLLELIYRAGAVQAVIVEAVYSNDQFSYTPGVDEKPKHVVDWFGKDGRGDLVGAYAYATLQGGATSKVVMVTKDVADRAKRTSRGSNSDYSPWKTNPEAMWMKTAVRQLIKWVPTSSEYRRTQLRDAQQVASEFQDKPAAQVTQMPPMPEPAEGEVVDELTGEVFDVEGSVDLPDEAVRA